MPTKKVFDRNMVEIIPGQKVRVTWPYYYINVRTDEGIVDRVDEYGGVFIRTDHLVPHYDRNGFVVSNEPWVYFPVRYNYEKEKHVASDAVGDPYEHGRIPIWIEVLGAGGEALRGSRRNLGRRAALGIAPPKVGQWIKADGTVTDVIPEKGKKFTLQELQKMVGGYVERVKLPGRRVMIANEDGYAMGLPHNGRASEIAGTDIVGDVVLLPAGMGW
jgi:hypothetical protein